MITIIHYEIGKISSFASLTRLKTLLQIEKLNFCIKDRNNLYIDFINKAHSLLDAHNQIYPKVKIAENILEQCNAEAEN